MARLRFVSLAGCVQRPLRPVFVSKMARAIYRSQSIDDFMKERNDRIVSRIVTRKIYPVKTFQGGTSPLKTRLRVYHEVFLHRAFDFQASSGSAAPV